MRPDPITLQMHLLDHTFLVSNVFNNGLSLDRRQSLIQSDMHLMLTNLTNKKTQFPVRYSITCAQLATFKFFIWKKFSCFIVVVFFYHCWIAVTDICLICEKNTFFFTLWILSFIGSFGYMPYLCTVCRVQAYQYSRVSQRSFSYRWAARTTCS